MKTIQYALRWLEDSLCCPSAQRRYLPVRLAKLTPNQRVGKESFEFGRSVASVAGLVLTGAHADDSPELDSGSAFLFDSETGAQQSSSQTFNTTIVRSSEGSAVPLY